MKEVTGRVAPVGLALDIRQQLQAETGGVSDPGTVNHSNQSCVKLKSAGRHAVSAAQLQAGIREVSASVTVTVTQ